MFKSRPRHRLTHRCQSFLLCIVMTYRTLLYRQINVSGISAAGAQQRHDGRHLVHSKHRRQIRETGWVQIFTASAALSTAPVLLALTSLRCTTYMPQAFNFVLQVREAGNTPLDYRSKAVLPRVCSRTKLRETEKRPLHMWIIIIIIIIIIITSQGGKVESTNTNWQNYSQQQTRHYNPW